MFDSLCVCLCDCGNGGGWITGAAHRKRKRAQTEKSKKIKNETAIHHEFKVREPRGLVTTTTTTNNQQPAAAENEKCMARLASCYLCCCCCMMLLVRRLGGRVVRFLMSSDKLVIRWRWISQRLRHMRAITLDDAWPAWGSFAWPLQTFATLLYHSDLSVISPAALFCLFWLSRYI